MSFLGQDGFKWAIGVCEDRFDPEKLGRIRVRWLGLHTEDKDKILTKDLPWSSVMQSGTGTNIAGVGDNSNIIEGTWVVGFSTDPESLQEWIVMGTLPGLNTRTAYKGGNVSGDTVENSFFGAVPHARAWNKARGDLKKIQEKYDGKTPNSEKVYLDYEKGFYDPTIDLRNIPYPPSAASYGNPVAGHSFTPSKEAPDLSLEDTEKKITRVPNYSDEKGGDHPSLLDLDGQEKANWEYATKKSISFVRATHSDVLHHLYKTTRRLTADRRFFPDWTHFGTFRWPDANTYFKVGNDSEPEGQEPKREFLGEYIDASKGREGVIFSTGYLEPDYWSENREYGSKGGTYGPAFPITRDTPTYIPQDEASLAGISPNDTRAGWGQGSGEETGYWSLKGEDYRVPNPRVRWVRKGHLTPTERQTVMELFMGGHYGSGIYNISDPDDGRQDIQWDDVKEDDLVVVPTPDTNPLAMGGIPISSTDGKTVTTVSSLWADSTTYFSDSNLSRGEPSKPLLQAGDIVQIAGCRGMQELNGRIFRLLSCSDDGKSFTMELGTADGYVWSGPGSISWTSVKGQLGNYKAEAESVKNDNWSTYLGGGVVIPHNPHWSLCWKADMRERQINIGSPDPETGKNHMHWNQPAGDYNARYPFNNVYESESGHIMEYDDTPGAERIHQMHRSGTYYEIDHNGTRTHYVKGDNYDIRLHDDYMYVKGKVVHTFDDEVMIRYNDRADISAAWKLQLWSGGDIDIHSKRNINFKADGDINFQADGHINLHGTGVTADQTDEYRAGSRNAKERSKIRMKAAHVEIEAIGDDTKPKQYGVFVQSNQAPIGLKTLSDGDAGDIHIAAGEDLELYAEKSQYRHAAGPSSFQGPSEYGIYDSSNGDYRLGTFSNIHFKSMQGNEVHHINNGITLNSGYDIHLNSINTYLTSSATIEMQSRLVDIYGDQSLALVSFSNLNIHNECGPVEIKAVTGTGGAGIIHLAGDTSVNIFPTLLTPSSGLGSASIPGNIGTPGSIAPESAKDSRISAIPETLELLSIDLPNPRPATGTSVSTLALNYNNLEEGIGGENIRNLHDTIENMQKGLSAYVTKTYPSTSDKKTYLTDQSEMVRTGGFTHELESPWTGYEDHNKTILPLGPIAAPNVPFDFESSAPSSTFTMAGCTYVPPLPPPEAYELIGASDWDQFGTDVSILGDKLLVTNGSPGIPGAQGHVSLYIYDLYDGSNEVEISASSILSSNGDPGTFGGFAVVDSHPTAGKIVIGSPTYIDSAPGQFNQNVKHGAVVIMDSDGSNSIIVKHPTSKYWREFGVSVACGSDRFVVGESDLYPDLYGSFSIYVGSRTIGAAYIYDYNGSLIATIPNPDNGASTTLIAPANASWIDVVDATIFAQQGELIFDLGGPQEQLVTYSGRTAIPGGWRIYINVGTLSPFPLGGTIPAGTTVTQRQYQGFGQKVTIGNNQIIVTNPNSTIPGDGSGEQVGVAYVYDLSGNLQHTLVGNDTDLGPKFGSSCAIDPITNNLYIGAALASDPYELVDPSEQPSGRIHMYDSSGTFLSSESDPYNWLNTQTNYFGGGGEWVSSSNASYSNGISVPKNSGVESSIFAVLSPRDDTFYSNGGAVHLFEEGGGLMTYTYNSFYQLDDGTGDQVNSLAIDYDSSSGYIYIVVGTWSHDEHGTNKGSVHVHPINASDYFGWSAP
jgi:hypothetical protein